jgi:uncharacterized protein (TIGR03435 family)
MTFKFEFRIGHVLSPVSILLGIAIPALGQSLTAAAAPQFEITDVHPSPPRIHTVMHGGMSHGDRYFLKDATLVHLIATSYQVDPDNVFGPASLGFDRFDIFAKAPAGTSDDSARLMIRALLADRFKLVAHTAVQPLPAFVLSVGKTSKLKQAAASADPGNCQFQQPPANPGGPMPIVNIKFSCRNVTMESFAELLHDAAASYLNHPVVDATGLKGGWDFDIEWTYQIPKDADGVTVFAAVDKQLGLKLEAKAAFLPVVIVDSVDLAPTPNRADIDKVLPPPPPAEFDVAVIRLSNPDGNRFRIDTEGNNVSIVGGTLQALIVNAYGLINADRIREAPSWLNTQHYDIVGKGSPDANPAPRPGGRVPDIDTDDVSEMLRSLLADRFKLVAHMELQPADAYALVAAGPKMKKADPANHPACKEGPGPDGKDPRRDNPLLNRLVSCQNMTMAQFADELSRLAGGYFPAPVINASGLEGAYDFTLSFSKHGDENKTIQARQSTAADSSAASDPTLGGMSVFDAVAKQLGLRLEKRDKVPQPFLVIDHVEEKPTDN